MKIKLRKQDAAAESETMDEGMTPVAEAARPGAYLASRHRAEEVIGGGTPSAGRYTAAGVAAIVAAVVYLAILTLLWLDWSVLKNA
jgi:hypothetical protein